MVARKVDWAKRLNRIHGAKRSRTKRRIVDPAHAVAAHARAVAGWQKTPYDRDEAESDIVGAMVANNSTDPQVAIDSLGNRPLGYTEPEAIDGQPEQEYVELSEQLATAAASGKVGRILEAYLVQCGRLPSRSELATEAGIPESEARRVLSTAQEIVLRVFTKTYVDECREAHNANCAKRITYSEDKLLRSLLCEAIPIEDTPTPLVENDLVKLERELIDNVLAAGLVALVPIVSALLRGDADSLASAIANLPNYAPTKITYRPTMRNPLGYPACGFDFWQRPSKIGENCKAALAAWNAQQSRNAEAQKRAEDIKRARLSAEHGTIAQQYRARYDRACWELYAN